MLRHHKYYQLHFYRPSRKDLNDNHARGWVSIKVVTTEGILVRFCKKIIIEKLLYLIVYYLYFFANHIYIYELPNARLFEVAEKRLTLFCQI